MIRLLTTLAVILGGAGLSVQSAMNLRLRGGTGSPVVSALLSFVVGGVALGALAATGALGRGRIPPPHSVPAWAWLGGLLGAFYVTLAVIAVPRIGTALLVGASVLGQLGAALALDTFGWLGLPRLPLSPTRLLGAMLLLAGVLLMQWKR